MKIGNPLTAPHHRPLRFRIEFPPELPISVRAEEITAAIQAHQVIILAGETGSGKTTQIPKMCLAAGRGAAGRIACTQPRRVAALSISRRVAEELGVDWGREVGCKIRFDDHTTPHTLIKFLTDGMLLAEVQGDPMLREYDTIIIDEAHERSLNIDFLLGHLRTLRFRRPELKIIITSATIDTAAFSAAFDQAPVILVEGRMFPVEVIHSPLDELGSDAAEGDEVAAKAEALHYVDGAVEAVERVVGESTGGDILVFMPSERDIRETRDLLEGRQSRILNQKCEIVPLFGRLSNAEQQRVFAPVQRRKIILATNIAETSLTIPGVRFVIDTGLARLSRYSPQARTRRLPIEEIAQSSAEQRKGRAGRVAHGVCIRLYSEKDFLERPRFTQPEIQRANLADVILRMKAFGLGDVERFPFINMPSAKAIRAGYALLEELGALSVERNGAATGNQRTEDGGRRTEDGGQGSEGGSEGNRGGGAERSPDAAPGPPASAPGISSIRLTPIGRDLARLPVDPTVGRMILQAREEKALREVIVIAAGLSIQDPRERPMDRQQQADAAHRRFVHPDSDFLTLLNIWETYHEEFETLSQAKLRRFCRDHFLSYTRMREWRDIHAQLLDVLGEHRDFKLTSALSAHGAKSNTGQAGEARGGGGAPGDSGRPRKPRVGADGESRGRRGSGRGEGPADPLAFGMPAYRAIHRSVLAGLLGNIACLDEEKGGYTSTHDRKVALFPGSVLFRREEPGKKGGAAGRGAIRRKESRGPRWIMASEMMETARLYARTCARIDLQWVLELGAHLVRVSHSEPFWNEAAGRVMVKRRTRLYGLEIDSRAVGYGRIEPVHATEIFIREGLVNDTVKVPLEFFAHNRRVRETVEDLLTRTRDSGFLNLDEAVFRFYAARLLPRGESDPASGAVAPTAAVRETDLPISCVAELSDLVRRRRAAEPRFLFMEQGDLRDSDTQAHEAGAYPEALPLQNRALPLNYAYRPGETDDGVTLEVSPEEAGELTPAALDWAVPGHLVEKVEHYLRALPKELRRGFVPLAETAKTLAVQLASRDRLTGRKETLPQALAAVIAGRLNVAIDPAAWNDKPPPDHLRVRVRVLDTNGRELVASRELGEIREALLARSLEASVAVSREDPAAWRAARAKWETAEHTSWAFGELPVSVLVTEQAGSPVHAFPGLHAGPGGVSRRLFRTRAEAEAATRRGVASLLEHQLGHELMWLQRDLRALRGLGALASMLGPLEDIQEQAFASIRCWVTDPDRLLEGSGPGGKSGFERTAVAAGRGTGEGFVRAVEGAKADLRGLVPRFVELLREILILRSELLVVADPPPGFHRDVLALVPPDFLRHTPYARLAHFPRYAKAMALRATRWRNNPEKDAGRAAEIAKYSRILEGLRGRPEAEPLRWLLEEFRVSLFAQELGTAEPVSAVKLDRLFAAASSGPAAQGEVPSAPPRPIVAVPLPERKPAPLKNLNALDRLFRR